VTKTKLVKIYVWLSSVNTREYNRIALTHRIGNTNSNNPVTAILDTPHFGRQLVNFTCWNAISNKNDDIWDVQSVSVGSVEYFCPRKSQSACRICVTAEVCNILDGVNE